MQSLFCVEKNTIQIIRDNRQKMPQIRQKNFKCDIEVNPAFVNELKPARTDVKWYSGDGSR